MASTPSTSGVALVHEVPASAYQCFAHHHYRPPSLGVGARAWCIRVGARDLGIVVTAHACLSARMRRGALPEALWQAPLGERAQALRDSLRVIQRVVVLPEARGQGLGRELLRRILPLQGVPFVEGMARNPQLFLASGMRLIEGPDAQSPPQKLAAFCESHFGNIPQCAAARASLQGKLSPEARRRYLQLLKAAWRWWRQSHGSHLRHSNLQASHYWARFWQDLAQPLRYCLWRFERNQGV
ncbi:MAG: GNAT family N-acetyltransferase [Planctomycetes bacterium]|nr:GNAT family N-acetyltransferase [Planctomycetota bacterium]